jgi:hypothetical protein
VTLPVSVYLLQQRQFKENAEKLHKIFTKLKSYNHACIVGQIYFFQGLLVECAVSEHVTVGHGLQ